MRNTLTLLLLLCISVWGMAQSEIALFSATPSPTAVSVANSSVTALSRGPGVVADAGTTFNSSDWSQLVFVDPFSNTDYLEWSITADPGFVVTIEQIEISYSRSGVGPNNISLRASPDSYVTPLFVDFGVSTSGETALSTLTSPQVSAAGGTLTFRLYGFMATAANGTFDIRGGLTSTSSLSLSDIGIRLIGAVDPAFDQTSQVIDPTPGAAQIVSQSIDPGQVKAVLRFRIEDPGDGDMEDTEVTQMRLVPGPTNTADWTDHIQDISSLILGSTPSTTTITPASVTISDTEIIMDINPGDIVVPDGSDELVTVRVELNATDCADGAILNFEVPGSNHGFQSDLTMGSGFADPFPSGGVQSNDHTVTVLATELRFAQQPSTTVVNQAMSPAVTVEATDVHGNRDVDITSDISITSSGSLVGAPVTVAAVDGLATFSTLTHSAVGTNFTLTADDVTTTLTSSVSSSFDISCGVTALGPASYTCASNTAGADNDAVTVQLPYTGVDANAMVDIKVAGSSVMNDGDDPAAVTDGTISFDANEGEAWSVTITGGVCNLSANGPVPSMECDPAADIVINEFLPAPDSDVNGDGMTNTDQDEFVELYNKGLLAGDISDWTINDNTGMRHTFPMGTILNPGEGMVVFGGGTPTGIPTMTQTATTGKLDINDGGDNIQLMDGANTIDAHSFSGSTTDVSYARSPDYTGPFVLHNSIPGNSVNASAGLSNTGNAPLPITLTTFTATPRNKEVLLRWATAVELNNDYMAVERSTDGRSYEELGRVNGRGTTQMAQQYQFVDTAPAPGVNYYRLRQVDFDGQYAYHGPVSLRMEGATAGPQLTVFPTIAQDAVTVQYEGGLTPASTLQVYSLDGRLWQTRQWEEKSIGQMLLPTATLPAGVYVLRLSETGKVARFIKQ